MVCCLTKFKNIIKDKIIKCISEEEPEIKEGNTRQSIKNSIKLTCQKETLKQLVQIIKNEIALPSIMKLKKQTTGLNLLNKLASIEKRESKKNLIS
jgi:hypothetical protein